jgi:hypothetical protein
MFLLGVALGFDGVVCVKTTTNFLDADVGSFQDYQSTNALRALRGVKIEIRNNTTQVVQTAYAATSGSSAGCATFNVTQGPSYAIRVYADVVINGSTLAVRAPNNSVWREVVAANKPFLSINPTVTYTLPTSDVWNIVAAGGFALHRHSFWGSVDVDFYTQDSLGQWNSPCGTGCVQGADVWLSPTKARQQFAVTNAIGLALLHNWGGVQFDDTMEQPDFNGGIGGPIHLISPEHPSAAHAAGFAHAYSAAIYNDVDADCGMVYWSEANWDLLGTPGGIDSCFEELETPAYARFSCATGRSPAAPAANQSAYYAHMGLSTSPAFETPVDVMRFWWDVMVTESLTIGHVLLAVVDTDPATWNTTGAISIESDLVQNGHLSQSTFDELSARHGLQ